MNEMNDRLRSGYDLRVLLNDGVRGQYVACFRTGANLILLDPDVARDFPDETAVNEALRLVIQLGEIQRRQEPIVTA